MIKTLNSKTFVHFLILSILGVSAGPALSSPCQIILHKPTVQNARSDLTLMVELISDTLVSRTVVDTIVAPPGQTCSYSLSGVNYIRFTPYVGIVMPLDPCPKNGGCREFDVDDIKEISHKGNTGPYVLNESNVPYAPTDGSVIFIY